MNILLQQGGHAFRNLGDLAMLQVTARRLQKEWQNCAITALSANGIDASQYVAGVGSVDANCVRLAFGPGCLFGRFSRFIGGADSLLVTKYPRLMRAAALKEQLRGRSPDRTRSFVRLLAEADIVAASGGGYLTDEFPNMVEMTARLLLAAQRLGKPTALFGQGIGPLQDRRLKRLLGQALRNVEVIGLREGLYSPVLTEELGVDSRKCVVTGDDALEPAHRAAPPTLGRKLGINLRRAWFAGVSDEMELRVSKVINLLTAHLQAEPLVIPIATDHADAEVGARLLGTTCTRPSSLEVSDVIRLAGECRVVLTGSYHAGVFALAQGIPTVGIAGSDYYRWKFLGLAAQFPQGCLVADTSSVNFESELQDAVLTLWERAESLRPQLLASASFQVEKSQQLYREFAQSMAGPARRKQARAV